MLSFFRKKPARVVHFAKYGNPLTLDDLKANLAGTGFTDTFRAVMQLVEHQRQLCLTAAQDKSNLLNGQHVFEVGGAAACSDLLLTLERLEAGDTSDRMLKTYFIGPPDKEE